VSSAVNSGTSLGADKRQPPPPRRDGEAGRADQGSSRRGPSSPARHTPDVPTSATVKGPLGCDALACPLCPISPPPPRRDGEAGRADQGSSRRGPPSPARHTPDFPTSAPVKGPLGCDALACPLCPISELAQQKPPRSAPDSVGSIRRAFSALKLRPVTGKLCPGLGTSSSLRWFPRAAAAWSTRSTRRLHQDPAYSSRHGGEAVDDPLIQRVMPRRYPKPVWHPRGRNDSVI
jgi:hypothetical protein